MTNAEWEAANEDDSDRWMRHEAETGLQPPQNGTLRPNDDRIVWRDRGVRIAALETENTELRAKAEAVEAALLRVRALADAFADDGLARYGGNVAWHIEEAIANEKGDFPDAADRRIASQRDRAESAEAEVERLLEGIRALADEPDGCETTDDGLTYWVEVERLRALLAPSPAATTGERPPRRNVVAADTPERYTVASADRCTVHPQHVMVNQGRSESQFADLFLCKCGKRAIGHTDESNARRRRDQP